MQNRHGEEFNSLREDFGNGKYLRTEVKLGRSKNRFRQPPKINCKKNSKAVIWDWRDICSRSLFANNKGIKMPQRTSTKPLQKCKQNKANVSFDVKNGIEEATMSF